MPVLTRFKAFILCFRNFKKLCPVWPGESIKNCKEQIEGETVMFNETLFGMFEIILESTPQSIIQLHATIVHCVFSEVAELESRACYVFAGFPTKWKVRLKAICVLSIEDLRPYKLLL